MKGDINAAFGAVIRDIRELNGLSQQELADYSDVDRTYISDLERGLHSPSLKTIYKLAEILKIKPNELVLKVDRMLKL